MKWFTPILRLYEAVFSLPAASVYAARELAAARLELLDAMRQQEYGTAMVQYNSDRVARLEAFLREAK